MFIVEDGTGKSNATSYASVEGADAYFNARLNQIWMDLELERKQAALIDATDYIDVRWGQVLKGKPLTETQTLLFPRDCPEGMPANLLKATYEYAVRASQSPLFKDPLVDESGYQVTGKSEKVGPIEEKTTYAYEGTGSNLMTTIPYPYPDGLMRPLVRQAGNRVIRN